MATYALQRLIQSVCQEARFESETGLLNVQIPIQSGGK